MTSFCVDIDTEIDENYEYSDYYSYPNYERATAESSQDASHSDYIGKVLRDRFSHRDLVFLVVFQKVINMLGMNDYKGCIFTKYSCRYMRQNSEYLWNTYSGRLKYEITTYKSDIITLLAVF